MVRRHLSPFFAGRAVDAIGPELIEAYMSAKTREALSVKTVGNHLTPLVRISCRTALTDSLHW